MSASRLYPKTYKGTEESGGYIARNESRRQENSPNYRGRFYLAGIGWFWLSGWIRDSSKGELISLSAKAMTDEEAQKYCAPQQGRKAERETQEPETNTQNEGNDSDIPF
jgi:hypothetical protein